MTVLIIDDEEALRRSISDYLEDIDMETVEAANGLEGLQHLDSYEDIHLVFVDLNMPVMDGYGFIEKAIERRNDLPIIVLSGVGIVDDAMRAIRKGAWDFISKPIPDLDILEHVMNRNLERARLVIENKRYQENLEQMVRRRTKELERTRMHIIHCLGKAAEYKDNETGNHVIRVGNFCQIIAEAAGLDADFCRTIRMAGPMHDIGKIGIPDHILLKEGPLDKDEWTEMKNHCRYGYDILSHHREDDEKDLIFAGPLKAYEEGGQHPNEHKGEFDCRMPLYESADEYGELLLMARRIAIYHHEKWDGSGYPCGLKGKEIPMEARIVALADVYDALGSDRSYKKAFPEEKCRSIIFEGRGSHFDPDLTDLFLAQTEKIKNIKQRWRD